ncbi:IS1634 family transposase [Microbacterium gubbeenense]|uniref:IS1634 family transposase n=1 Tax=Microbacterium gubbeenense TaxID=159896 RepID=UPI003F99DD27
MSPYLRTVKTASGATAVQIVEKTRGARRIIEHLGSAHTPEDVALLKAAGRQKLAGDQPELDLGLEPVPDRGGPLPMRVTMGPLWRCLNLAFDALRLGDTDGADDVFRQLVLARIIEPTSKADMPRVLDETGVSAVSYATIKRRLPVFATDTFRDDLARVLASNAQLGPAALVLYDVTTLYYEAHEGDGFREPGFSKERRLEPQITVGLLTDASGFPLRVEAFEGNKSEQATMLPTLRAFMTAHGLENVTVVADAGMVSEANKKAIEKAGLGFILGAKTPRVPPVIERWTTAHPGEQIPDGHVFTQPWPAGPTDDRRDHVFYYRYKHDNARRTLKGIDEQVRKAESAVAGKIPVKRNRFVTLTGEERTVNRELEEKARSLAGIKGYVTNLTGEPAEFIISSYHRLLQVEKSFRMSKSDLRARPIYARLRDSIDAHLQIVIAALAVSRWVEETTGWSVKKFVQTLRVYREGVVTVNGHEVATAVPLEDDAAVVVEAVKTRAAAGH